VLNSILDLTKPRNLKSLCIALFLCTFHSRIYLFYQLCYCTYDQESYLYFNQFEAYFVLSKSSDRPKVWQAVYISLSCWSSNGRCALVRKFRKISFHNLGSKIGLFHACEIRISIP